MKCLNAALIVALFTSCASPLDKRIATKDDALLESVPHQSSLEQQEHLPKNRYQEGIKQIAADKEWQGLHEFLHRVTSPGSSMKLETTQQQQRYVDDSRSFSSFQREEEQRFLYRIISSSGHSKDIDLADLIFLHEVHVSLHEYMNGASAPPRPHYDVTTRFHFSIPKQTNASPRIP